MEDVLVGFNRKDLLVFENPIQNEQFHISSTHTFLQLNISVPKMSDV